MAEGQKLRWWQQDGEEQSQASQQATERVLPEAAPLLPVNVPAPSVVAPSAAVSAEEDYHDTWEDLEVEAVRRAEQTKVENTESLSFYMDKSTALVRHRREGRTMAWCFGSLVLLLMLIPLIFFLTDPHHHHSPPPFGVIGAFAGVFSMFYQRRKWLEENEKPTLRLSPQGLFIHTAMQNDVMLPWNEIEEIAAKGKPKKRHLEIRASKRRKFVIEERDLPITADAAASRIAVFETGRLTA